MKTGMTIYAFQNGYGDLTDFTREEEAVWMIALILGVFLGYLCGRFGKGIYMVFLCGIYVCYWFGRLWSTLKMVWNPGPGISYGGPILYFRYGVLLFPVVWTICIYYIFYFGIKKRRKNQ